MAERQSFTIEHNIYFGEYIVTSWVKGEDLMTDRETLFSGTLEQCIAWLSDYIAERAPWAE